MRIPKIPLVESVHSHFIRELLQQSFERRYERQTFGCVRPEKFSKSLDVVAGGVLAGWLAGHKSRSRHQSTCMFHVPHA